MPKFTRGLGERSSIRMFRLYQGSSHVPLTETDVFLYLPPERHPSPPAPAPRGGTELQSHRTNKREMSLGGGRYGRPGRSGSWWDRVWKPEQRGKCE